MDGEAIPLRYAAGIAEWPTIEQQIESSPALRTLRSSGIGSDNPRPATKTAQGSLVRTELPGPIATELPRCPLPARWTSPLAAGPIAGIPRLLTAQDGHPFNWAQFALGFAGVAGMRAPVVLVDPHRRPRPGLGRVAPPADATMAGLAVRAVVSVSSRGNEVLLQRGDGRGMAFRRNELRAGAADMLLTAFGKHRALTLTAH